MTASWFFRKALGPDDGVTMLRGHLEANRPYARCQEMLEAAHGERRCPGCGTCDAASEVERLRERLAVAERERDVQARWMAYVGRFEAGLAEDDARQVALSDEWSSTDTDGLDDGAERG